MFVISTNRAPGRMSLANDLCKMSLTVFLIKSSILNFNLHVDHFEVNKAEIWKNHCLQVGYNLLLNDILLRTSANEFLPCAR